MENKEDFLRQLRSVHFWLVVFSVGLIVIASLPKKADLQRAYEQARELSLINEVLTQPLLLHTAANMEVPPLAKCNPNWPGEKIPWHGVNFKCTFLSHSSKPDSPRFSVWMTEPG